MAAVDVFNGSADATHRLDTETPPEPFLGPLDAPVVVLLLNPGVDKSGKYAPSLANVVRAAEPQGSHFYIGGGNSWWDRLVGQLTRDREGVNLGKSILSVEFFPYRSASFGCGHVRLPSQEFSFALVRQAIKRNAEIVVARGADYWIGAVPELVTGCDLIHIRNPRMASLSPRNLGDHAYQRLLAAIDRRA
jgi:hypothetical protein